MSQFTNEKEFDQKLRIGNKLMLGISIVTISEICEDGIETPEHGFVSASQLRGIPITPERLESLGFHDRSGTLKNRMAFGIILRGNLLELVWYVMKNLDEGIRFQTIGSGVTYDTKITTIHRLQNLYYDLEGEELAIDKTSLKD